MPYRYSNGFILLFLFFLIFSTSIVSCGTDTTKAEEQNPNLEKIGNLPLTGETFERPVHIRLLSGGKAAIVSDFVKEGNLFRVDLQTLEVTRLSSENIPFPYGFSIDKSYSYAYIMEHQSPGRVLRVALSDGSVQPMTEPLFLGPTDLLLEDSGETALVADYLNSKILRVSLKDCFPSCPATQIAGLTTPHKMVPRLNNGILVTTFPPTGSGVGSLYQLDLADCDPLCQPSLVKSGLNRPESIAITGDGGKAYVAETPLNRITELTLLDESPLTGVEGTGGQSSSRIIASGLSRPQSLVLEAGEKTLLVTESPGGGKPGRILRIPIP